MLDHDVQQFVDFLNLSDNEILEKFALTDYGRKLSDEEARAFLTFIRSEIAIFGSRQPFMSKGFGLQGGTKG